MKYRWGHDGQGTKDTICTLLDLLCAHLPGDKLAGHFHDTNHQAIANVKHALGYGLGGLIQQLPGLAAVPMRRGPKAM